MSDGIADLLGDIFVSKEKKAKVIRQATEEESERAATAVNKALETKSLMSYGRFWSYVTQQPRNKFRPSELNFTIRVAEAVQPGASALLVNRNGTYGKKAPAEQHVAFLKANEYDER